MRLQVKMKRIFIEKHLIKPYEPKTTPRQSGKRV